MILDTVGALALRAFQKAGATAAQALPVARSIRTAERDGMRSHGLLYLSVCIEHLTRGKVDSQAELQLQQHRAEAVLVDATHGFAHMAIGIGLPALTKVAQGSGLAARAKTEGVVVNGALVAHCGG